jgi:hypothetical protein
MSGGKVFDYQIQEIFGETIASPEAVGNEVHYQRGAFANILHHDPFACIKASFRHSNDRIEATEFMRFGCCECGGWWLKHGTAIRMIAMGAEVPPNIAGIFSSRHPKSIAGSSPRRPVSFNFAVSCEFTFCFRLAFSFSSFAFAFPSFALPSPLAFAFAVAFIPAKPFGLAIRKYSLWALGRYRT